MHLLAPKAACIAGRSDSAGEETASSSSNKKRTAANGESPAPSRGPPSPCPGTTTAAAECPSSPVLAGSFEQMRRALHRVFGSEFVKVFQVGPRVASGGLLGDHGLATHHHSHQHSHEDSWCSSAPNWLPTAECQFCFEYYAVAHQQTPTLWQLLRFCRSACAWLEMDARNVIVVNSSRGASLAGVFIAALWLFRKDTTDPQHAMFEYMVSIGRGQRALKIPSQRRYVGYFHQILLRSDPQRFLGEETVAQSFVLTRCICFGVNPLWKEALWVSVENQTSNTELYSSIGAFSAVSVDQKKSKGPSIDDNYVSIRFSPHQALYGDLRVKLHFRQVKLCSVAVNTAFLESANAVTVYFPLDEVDDACRPRNKNLFPDNFGIRLFFAASPVAASPVAASSSSAQSKPNSSATEEQNADTAKSAESRKKEKSTNKEKSRNKNVHKLAWHGQRSTPGATERPSDDEALSSTVCPVRPQIDMEKLRASLLTVVEWLVTELRSLLVVLKDRVLSFKESKSIHSVLKGCKQLLDYVVITVGDVRKQLAALGLTMECDKELRSVGKLLAQLASVRKVLEDPDSPSKTVQRHGQQLILCRQLLRTITSLHTAPPPECNSVGQFGREPLTTSVALFDFDLSSSTESADHEDESTSLSSSEARHSIAATYLVQHYKDITRVVKEGTMLVLGKRAWKEFHVVLCDHALFVFRTWKDAVPYASIKLTTDTTLVVSETTEALETRKKLILNDAVCSLVLCLDQRSELDAWEKAIRMEFK
eukprot:CAMPEP_0174232656 /NCGR_PEP_ID=MMETSP0417-20130205/2877_1 /TAXON_ID=242541 /ORGANISM="Mayorella sp, Strain BSH-02190019" /LENGTH=763 /DNA_ID=CAMNT_0015310739 /DNA_START=446 /DNA_END=2737 /DNA_ORIENTATION=-